MSPIFNSFGRQSLPRVPPGRGRSRRAWRRLSWLVVGAVLYGAYLYLGGSSGLIQYWRLSQKRAQCERDITVLQARQDSLQQVIYALQYDTTYIEKIARERYNMGRPGETIYTVVKQPKTDDSRK